MSDSTPISPDLPELQSIAQLAAIKPSHLAAAFNDPQHFLAHITLEELERFVDAFNRLSALRVRMMGSMEAATTSLADTISTISTYAGRN